MGKLVGDEDDVVSGAVEEAGADGGAVGALAVHPQLSVGDLVESVSEFRQGDVQRAADVGDGVLVVAADVEDQWVLPAVAAPGLEVLERGVGVVAGGLAVGEVDDGAGGLPFGAVDTDPYEVALRVGDLLRVVADEGEGVFQGMTQPSKVANCGPRAMPALSVRCWAA